MRNVKKDRCVLTSVIETEFDILNRHIHVLRTLQESQPMGIIKLSELTNYPQHMVRYSLRILEQDGLIEPSPRGAITTDAISETMSSLKKTLGGIATVVEELIKKLEWKYLNNLTASAAVTQLGECTAEDRDVEGSSPSRGTSYNCLVDYLTPPNIN